MESRKKKKLTYFKQNKETTNESIENKKKMI